MEIIQKTDENNNEDLEDYTSFKGVLSIVNITRMEPV